MKWLVLFALILTACSPVTPTLSPTPPSPSNVPTVAPVTSQPPTPVPPQTCSPTDQDQYVYNPSRLVVLAACIRVTGTVAAIRIEADGDYHILVALDPQFQYLLTPANQGIELGDLVVEPVCEHSVTQSDAVAACAGDHTPLSPLPVVGEHVWLEGRYVTDSAHGGWAELHPLYRWAVVAALSEGEGD